MPSSPVLSMNLATLNQVTATKSSTISWSACRNQAVRYPRTNVPSTVSAQPVRPGKHVFARRTHGGDHVPALRMEVARGFQSVSRRAACNEHGFHAINVSGRTTGRSTMQRPYLFCDRPASHRWRCSSRDARPALRNPRAAPAAHRVLQAHQRRRPLGCALLRVWRAKLLRRARRQLPPGGRWPSRAHARSGRLHPPAGDAGFHLVRLRAGEARAHRPEGHLRGDR